MSETRNYISTLDQWSEEVIIAPIADAHMHGPDEVIVRAKEVAQKGATREKVVKCYHNGQSIAPRGNRAEERSYETGNILNRSILPAAFYVVYTRAESTS